MGSLATLDILEEVDIQDIQHTQDLVDIQHIQVLVVSLVIVPTRA